MGHTHPGLWLLAGILLTLLLLGLRLRVGSYATDYAFILKTLWHYNPADPAQLVLVQLQLPRLLAGSLGLFIFLQKDLNLLLLGEERAQALGLPVARLRWLLLALVVALTDGVVALCGPVGFAGLVVPHLTRGLLGTVGRLNLAFCAVLGGGFLLACDLLARLLYPPAGLPVGPVTALLGVPFFVSLLRKKSF